jgi:hypothetical protein
LSFIPCHSFLQIQRTSFREHFSEETDHRSDQAVFEILIGIALCDPLKRPHREVQPPELEIISCDDLKQLRRVLNLLLFGVEIPCGLEFFVLTDARQSHIL